MIKINDEEEEIDLNKNKMMHSFASGLKAGLMQKVIAKLKDTFKSKEVFIKQLIEENRDLFLQLDIEKAKFQQVVHFQDKDLSMMQQMQATCERMQHELHKEKDRHSYYKKLMRDFGDLDEVKKVLDLSASDVDMRNNDDMFKSLEKEKLSLRKRETLTRALQG